MVPARNSAVQIRVAVHDNRIAWDGVALLIQVDLHAVGENEQQFEHVVDVKYAAQPIIRDVVRDGKIIGNIFQIALAFAFTAHFSNLPRLTFFTVYNKL